jgi:hypothetical protein
MSAAQIEVAQTCPAIKGGMRFRISATRPVIMIDPTIGRDHDGDDLAGLT